MQLAIDTFDKERFGLITGSKCTVMFPLKGNGLIGMRSYGKKLANEMFFQFYDEKTNWQTEHGKMAEHFAFIHYQEIYSEDIEIGRWIKKGECGGTTDAEIKDVKGIDFKCSTTLENWLEYLYEDIDMGQQDQCQMYMYLTGLPQWEIAAYLVETSFMSDNGLTYPVPESKRMIIKTIDKDPEWEGNLIEKTPIVINFRNEFIEKLKGKFL